MTAVGQFDSAEDPALGPLIERPGLERPATARRGGTSKHRPRSFAVTFLVTVLIAMFLAPLAQSFLTSLKSPEQTSALNSPIFPADPATYVYEGKTYDVYLVPIDGEVRELALIRKGRTDSDFIDPANPEAGPINWVGAWRTLEQPWQLAPQWSNYGEVWNLINFPLLLRNTILLAVISMVGTVVSCTLVAYGFARFRFPGRNFLLLLLIATIFLPDAVTLIPTYTIFVKLGWVGTWLPLLVPTFFANAYDVFLLRQYLLTIPPELDEAAAIDGAGPFKTLTSVIIPQAWPAIIAVSIFHFVYSWNDFFGPLIYLSGEQDLQPLQVALARFEGIHYQNPGYIQAGNIMTLIIPILLFIVFQRSFTRGIVITGVEK
jgi:multiple sugar transport system permease protein